MHNDISVGDMFNLEDGQKVLSRYNEMMPGIVDKTKTLVRKGVEAHKEIDDIDGMIDEIFLVIAMLCARNSSQIKEIEGEITAKNAATTMLVSMVATALTAVDAVDAVYRLADTEAEKRIPAEAFETVAVRSTMRLLALRRSTDKLGQNTFELAKHNVELAEQTVHTCGHITAEEGLKDCDKRGR